MNGRRSSDTGDTNIVINEMNTTRENRRSRQVVFYVVIIVALAVIVAFALFRFFFRVNSITLDGEGKYAESDIVGDSGIRNGQSIFFVSEKKVEEKLKNKYPYIESVSLDIDLPSTVKIAVKERIPTAYLELKGDCYLLSDDMYVLERVEKNAVQPGMIEIKTLVTSLRSVIVGKKIEFYYEKTSDSIIKLFGTLKENGIKQDVESVKVYDRFSISMRYGGRFNVYVGSVDSIEIKIPFLKEIIKKLGDSVTGTIDISSEKNATFSPDK